MNIPYEKSNGQLERLKSLTKELYIRDGIEEKLRKKIDRLKEKLNEVNCKLKQAEERLQHVLQTRDLIKEEFVSGENGELK